MTREQVINLAKQVTAPEWWDDSADGWHMGLNLEQFAALAAAVEREECAKVCDLESDSWIDKFSDGAVSAKACAALIRARRNNG